MLRIIARYVDLDACDRWSHTIDDTRPGGDATLPSCPRGQDARSTSSRVAVEAFQAPDDRLRLETPGTPLRRARAPLGHVLWRRRDRDAPRRVVRIIVTGEACARSSFTRILEAPRHLKA